jgi:hypothetical protein
LSAANTPSFQRLMASARDMIRWTLRGLELPGVRKAKRGWGGPGAESSPAKLSPNPVLTARLGVQKRINCPLG